MLNIVIFIHYLNCLIIIIGPKLTYMLSLNAGRKNQKSYLNSYKNVFATASANEFYSQCFPPSFVDFAFSATAVHWLRKRYGLPVMYS